MPISALPHSERPRERLAAQGPGALADRELLALLLGTGGAAGVGAHELAERLLGRFGSLTALSTASAAELTSIKGIGAAKAAGLVASFELARRAKAASSVPTRIRSTSDIARVARPMLAGRHREHLVLITCDVGSRVLGAETVSHDAADHTLFPVREIIVAVLRRDGRYFALAHNHPSGDPAPSPADVSATRIIAEAASTAGLLLLDHVVITDTAWRRVLTNETAE